MNLESRRMFAWLCAGSLCLAACSKKDDGVGATLPGQDKDSVNDEDSKSEDSDSGEPGHPSDAGTHDPAEAEVVVIEPPDATCAATSQEAKQVTTIKEVVVEVPKEEIKPVAIYLMLDRSSSMIGYCPGGGGAGVACDAKSWEQASQGISQFAADPASANLDVALGYFPPVIAETDRSATSPYCTGVSCSKAAVTIDKAERNAGKIASSLAGAKPLDPNLMFPPGPINFTPTECAIGGLSAFCKEHKMRTGQKCVGVLVTDGKPQGECNTNPDALNALAMTAAMEGTPLFTLGMVGADFAFLDRIATSGGTDCTPNAAGNACDVRTGKEAFVAALNAIRETIKVTETRIDKVTTVTEEPIDCEWTIPPPPMDQKFDAKKVNVRFSAMGKDARTLGKTTKDECAMFPEGWYYDDEAKPTKVLACGTACDEIKASMGAKISIELGCQTELIK